MGQDRHDAPYPGIENKMTVTQSQNKAYNWIELAALLPNGKMVRGHYIRRDDSAGIAARRRCFLNTDVFSSIARYAAPNNGGPFILPLHFDIDCPDDLETARRSTITLCEMLMDRIRLPQDCLDIDFSGCKGFHVVVDCEVFRAFASPQTLGLYRRMARRARDAGVLHIDQSVYTRKRLWRLVNSRHGKSGLFKIPLIYEELRDISAEGIKLLAAHPRPEDSLARHQECEEAVQWYRQAIAAVARLERHSGHATRNAKFRRGWRVPPCIKAMEKSVLPDGARHQTYLSLARFWRWLGMHPDEMHERISAIDSRNLIRDPDYIERAIKWGCEHPGFPGCNDESLRRYCRPEKCFYAKLKRSQNTDR